ncbi:MAG: Clostripain family [Bacteroidota bacterium]
MTVAENTSKTYSWLITFLIYDNAWYDKEHKNEQPGYISLEVQKNALYASINSLEIHEKIKVVFIEAKINVPEKVLEIWVRSKTTNTFEAERIENPAGVLAMSNNDSLSNILKPIIDGNSADRHILVTVGHGSIFGINLYSEKDDTQLPPGTFTQLASQDPKIELTPELLKKFEKDKELANLLPVTLTRKLNIASQIDKIFYIANHKDFEIAVPELNLTVLTVKEISTAFKSVFNDIILDILVLDNCLMQNLFTQFELCETVNYLVAAQSGISYPGFNYAAIIEKICTDITIDAGILANEFVNEQVIRGHPEYELFKLHIESSWCLNTVCLDKDIYKRIKQEFIDFFELLNTLIGSPENKIKQEIYQIIKSTNDQLFGYNAVSLPTIKIIDLHVFLIFFKEIVGANFILANYKEKLLLKADNLKAALSKISVKSFVGKGFYPENNYYKDEDNTNSIGFGFMLPVKPTGTKLIDRLYEKKGDIAYCPQFLHNSEYFNFINHLWEMSPPGHH